MPSPEKFRETIDDFKVDQNIIDEMVQGFDGNGCLSVPTKA